MGAKLSEGMPDYSEYTLTAYKMTRNSMYSSITVTHCQMYIIPKLSKWYINRETVLRKKH